MSTRRAADARTSCPVCGGEAVEIVYGYPDTELFEAADRGEVMLGGCMVGGVMPTAACRVCSHQWRAG